MAVWKSITKSIRGWFGGVKFYLILDFYYYVNSYMLILIMLLLIWVFPLMDDFLDLLFGSRIVLVWSSTSMGGKSPATGSAILLG